jgi:hypothetical protein
MNVGDHKHWKFQEVVSHHYSLFSYCSQEYHHSLDTGDEHLSRPCSAFAKIFEPKSDQDKATLSSNLVKGKSMPSLR